ncbi:MAG TPA: hypothetical protein VF209_03405 [Patescibacteria group bacterium]
MTLKLTLSETQLEKLSELLLDIAKSLFIATLAVPLFATHSEIFIAMKSLVIAICCTIFSIKLLEYT